MKRFFLLFAAALVVFIHANPVYKATEAYIFPEGGLGDRKIYYSVKNGYSDHLAWPLPETAYGQSITGVSGVRGFGFKEAGGANRQPLSLAGDRGCFEAGGRVFWLSTGAGEAETELPAGGARLLVERRGETYDFHLSNIHFHYERLFAVNRAVAATFPFLLAYTASDGNGTFFFDRAVRDGRVHDTSGDRDLAGYDVAYLDMAADHYIAPRFQRERETWPGWTAAAFIVLAALCFSLFLHTVPGVLRRAWGAPSANRPLFIFLAVYVLALYGIFRHSTYFELDGVLNYVIRLEFNSMFSSLYMCLEYVFYIVGYGSRVLCMPLLNALMIWNYDLILSRYFTTPRLKALKWLLLALPALSPQMILFAVNSQRIHLASALVVMGFLFFLRHMLLRHNTFPHSLICLLAAVACRQDFVVFFLPPLFSAWLDRLTPANTLKLSVCGLLLLGYANTVPYLRPNLKESRDFYHLVGAAFMMQPVVGEHHSELSAEERDIIERTLKNGVEYLRRMAAVSPTAGGGSNQPVNSLEHVAEFNALALKLALRYPGTFLENRLSLADRMFVYYTTVNKLYNGPDRGGRRDNSLVELPHKNILFKRAVKWLVDAQAGRYLKWYPLFLILPLLIVGAALGFRLRQTGLISGAFLLYYGLLVLAAPGHFFLYMTVFHIWTYFAVGLFLAESRANATLRGETAARLALCCLAGLAFLIATAPRGPEAFSPNGRTGRASFDLPASGRPLTLAYPFLEKFIRPNFRVRIAAADGRALGEGRYKLEARGLAGWMTLEAGALPAGAAMKDITRYRLGLYDEWRVSVDGPDPSRALFVRVFSKSFARHYAAALALLLLFLLFSRRPR